MLISPPVPQVWGQWQQQQEGAAIASWAAYKGRAGWGLCTIGGGPWVLACCRGAGGEGVLTGLWQIPRTANVAHGQKQLPDPDLDPSLQLCIHCIELKNVSSLHKLN